MIVEVTDAADPRLDPFRWRERQLASGPQRREATGAGMFVAEGDLVVDRALATGREPVALLCERTHAERLSTVVRDDVPVYVGDDALRKHVTGLGVPLSATGLFRRPAPVGPGDLLRTSRLVVVAEAVDNPTNLGAVVRSAVALGWDGLLLDSTSADPLARRALRVSMGTGLSLPHARTAPGEDISGLLAAHGFVTYALTPGTGALDISEVPRAGGPVALMLGSERSGLSTDLLSPATHRVRIPMHAGTDSLNVGAAAAVALHVLGPNGR
ncbi:MAG: TrmH family RNA methyltransferase [Acidimicrobiales bacterium]